MDTPSTSLQSHEHSFRELTKSSETPPGPIGGDQIVHVCRNRLAIQVLSARLYGGQSKVKSLIID